MSSMAFKANEMLASAIRSGRAFHAFFISCPDQELGASIVRRAAVLACLGDEEPSRLFSYPDYHELHGDKLTVGEVRGIVEELSRSAFVGGWRAIVILSAHAMPKDAQNALLKSVEEPPSSTLFLFTGNAAGVLPTILSRCCVVRVGLPGREAVCHALTEQGASPAEGALYAAMSGGSLDRGRRLYQEEAFRELRLLSQNALISLLGGKLPAASTKPLARAGAGDALAFQLSFLRDMLLLRTGEAVQENPDRRGELTQLAPRFTIGRILCMIEWIVKATEELYLAEGGELYPAAVLDGLFLRISEEIKP